MVKTIYFAHLIEYTKEPVINTIVKILGDQYSYKYVDNGRVFSNKYINFIFKKINIFINIFKIRDSIIQSFHIETTFFALLFNRYRNNRIIFNYTEIYSESLSNKNIRLKIISKYYQVIEPFTLKNSDVIIVPSNVRKEYIIKKYPFLVNKDLYVIENISTYKNDIFVNKEIVGYLKHKHIMYIGTFKENRKLELLVEVAEELYSHGIRVYLLGSENNFLNDKILVHKNIYYFGRVKHEELLSMLRKCYIGIVIYDDNNINNYLCAPLKIFDYINASVPFVAVDFPYIKEMKERINSDVFKTFQLNKKEFLKSILELDNEYDKYKKNIENLDKGTFKWDSQKNEIQKIYNKLNF